MQTTARRDGDRYLLSGSKIYITNSLHADVYCIAAKTNPDAGHRGISMFLVERSTPGFTVEELHGKLGRRAEGAAALKELFAVQPMFSEKRLRFMRALLFSDKAVEAITDGLIATGLEV